MRTIDDLTEKEVLALAISAEEEDGRIYADFADRLHQDYPESAKSSRRCRPRKTSTAAA
jgi:rubrerythrin